MRPTIAKNFILGNHAQIIENTALAELVWVPPARGFQQSDVRDCDVNTFLGAQPIRGYLLNACVPNLFVIRRRS